MSDLEHDNAIRIAVIDEQIAGLREQQKAHNESTQKRFDGMEKKIDELTTVINKGKGAYAASMIMAAAIGAVILAFISWIFSQLHR